MMPASPTRPIRCWMFEAVLATAAGRGPATGNAEAPPPARASAAVNLPLACPSGVALCSGVGAAVTGRLPVSGAELQRQDAAQLFRVTSPGWPALARLVVRRTAPAPVGSQPQLQLEVRRTWGGLLNDRPLASGTLAVTELPCTEDGAGGCVDGNEVPIEVPLVPAKGARALTPGTANRPNEYVLAVRALPGDVLSAAVALHGQDYPDGQAFSGQSLRVAGGNRPWPTMACSGAGGDLAFALVLERDRLAGCTDGVLNGVETDVDCGGSAPLRCGAGRRCFLDSDCYLNGECTLNVCTCPAGSSCFVYPCLSLTCGPNATCTGGLGAGWACNTCYAGDGVTCAPAVPGTSGSVTATAGYQQVALSWAAVPCATTYNLYRSVGGGSFSLVQSSVSGTALTDTGLTNGTNYGYVVRAVNAAGEGTGSSAVYATPFAPTATRTWAYNGDTNGALYWLGSARGLGSWANPLRTGYATGSNSATITGCSTLSSTTSCDTGWTSNRNVGTTVNPANASDILVSTTSTTTAFVRHDLGADHTLVLNRYALRSRCDAASHYPRNWLLQGSNDGSNWTTLRPHAFEGTLLARCRWSSWAISSSIGYRCFRIARDGTLSFSGSSPTGAVIFDEVEFYGTVTYVPATPTGVMATGISQGVTVQWNAVTRALSYNLFVSTDGVTFSLQASGITATSTSATGLTPGGQRFFRVQASNLGGVSAQGATVTAAAL